MIDMHGNQRLRQFKASTEFKQKGGIETAAEGYNPAADIGLGDQRGRQSFQQDRQLGRCPGPISPRTHRRTSDAGNGARAVPRIPDRTGDPGFPPDASSGWPPSVPRCGVHHPTAR
eukprot:Anaeramoba_flamelloidesa1056449_13.p1 GENE.a1056449_13~~a1056449_13.p1  ORF type:complete len:116 (+),score=1.53 a1056449_13:162-509(+)